MIHTQILLWFYDILHLTDFCFYHFINLMETVIEIIIKFTLVYFFSVLGERKSLRKQFSLFMMFHHTASIIRVIENAIIPDLIPNLDCRLSILKFVVMVTIKS